MSQKNDDQRFFLHFRLYRKIHFATRDELVNLRLLLCVELKSEPKQVTALLKKMPVFDFSCRNFAPVYRSFCKSCEPEYLPENYDKTVRDWFYKVSNAIFGKVPSVHLALPADIGGLRVSSASLLALLSFLVSAFDTTDFLLTVFGKLLKICR